MARREFDPLDIFLQLENDIARSAEHAIQAVRFQPRVDMHETGGALIVKIELAGVRPEQINVTLSGDDRVLIISGERSETSRERQERVRCYHLEIYYGPFERRITLPPELRIDRDGITASYRDGFVTINLPRRIEVKPRTRTIEINRD